MMYNIMTHNMANMMAEDTGLFELRDPMIRETRETGRTSGLNRRH